LAALAKLKELSRKRPATEQSPDEAVFKKPVNLAEMIEDMTEKRIANAEKAIQKQPKGKEAALYKTTYQHQNLMFAEAFRTIIPFIKEKCGPEAQVVTKLQQLQSEHALEWQELLKSNSKVYEIGKALEIEKAKENTGVKQTPSAALGRDPDQLLNPDTSHDESMDMDTQSECGSVDGAVRKMAKMRTSSPMMSPIHKREGEKSKDLSTSMDVDKRSRSGTSGRSKAKKSKSHKSDRAEKETKSKSEVWSDAAKALRNLCDVAIPSESKRERSKRSAKKADTSLQSVVDMEEGRANSALDQTTTGQNPVVATDMVEHGTPAVEDNASGALNPPAQ